MTIIKNFLNEEDGADMVEYALLIGLVALAALGTLTTVGKDLSNGFTTISGKITASIK